MNVRTGQPSGRTTHRLVLWIKLKSGDEWSRSSCRPASISSSARILRSVAKSSIATVSHRETGGAAPDGDTSTDDVDSEVNLSQSIFDPRSMTMLHISPWRHESVVTQRSQRHGFLLTRIAIIVNDSKASLSKRLLGIGNAFYRHTKSR